MSDFAPALGGRIGRGVAQLKRLASATGLISAVDSNFTVSSGTLKLASVPSGNVVGNSGPSSGEATAATLTALLDRAFGSAEGQLLQRGATAWQVLAPGTPGQLLQSGGASALNSWVTPTLGATASASAGTPAGTTSTTGVMVGLGGSITPVASGKVLFLTSGFFQTTANTTNEQIGMQYGTGSAPANGAAKTGTQVGQVINVFSPASESIGFAFFGIVSGLTLNTAYWFDLYQAAFGGGYTLELYNPIIVAFELGESF